MNHLHIFIEKNIKTVDEDIDTKSISH